MSIVMGKASFEERSRDRLASEPIEINPAAFAATFDLLRVANRLVQDFETNVHRPLGISWAGFRLLFCAWVEGSVEPRRLASLCAVSRATTSSVLNTLERDGLLKRERLSADRRIVSVSLTAKGRKTVVKAFKSQHQREQAWLASINSKKLNTLVEVLRTLLRTDVTDR
jgi:DNA-binding MarR family transcriptional regulator